MVVMARRPARRFKVIQVSGGAVLVEGAGVRATVDVLTGIDSIFDVLVYTWVPSAHAWRLLTPGEQRTLWDFRGR